MHVGQLDLSLRVAVCAWCKPRAPLGDIRSLSHGICPRHLRKFKQEVEGIVSVPQRRRRGLPQSITDGLAQEALPF